MPDFPRADKITPRMLANSTTGISDYVTNPDFLKIFYANPIKGFTSQEIFDLANARPPLFEPGTSFAYAHSDLCLLGVVLEKAAGKPLGNLLKERIFTPLGMDASSVMLTPQMSEPILHGYTNERGVFEDSTFWNPTAFLNSGNMNSTVADVARWVRALGTGELLSDTAFTEMMADKTAGLGPLTADKYFAFGTVHLGSWLLMNPAFGGTTASPSTKRSRRPRSSYTPRSDRRPTQTPITLCRSARISVHSSSPTTRRRCPDAHRGGGRTAPGGSAKTVIATG